MELFSIRIQRTFQLVSTAPLVRMVETDFDRCGMLVILDVLDNARYH